MKAGTLIVDIAMNLSRLQQDVGQAKGMVQDASREIERSIGVVKSALGALGITLSAGFFAKWIEGSYSAQASMLRFAQTAGTTVEVFSSLRPAMKNSQTDAEEVAKGMQKLAKNMAESGDGTSKAAKVFDTLKISLSDAGGGMRQTQDVMRELGGKLMSMKDQTLAVAFAQEVLGKSGANLLPFLYELAASGTQQAKVTTEQAKAAKEFEDGLVRLKSSSEDYRNHVANDLLPTLQMLLDKLNAIKAVEGGGFIGFMAKLGLTGEQATDPLRALEEIDAKLEKLRSMRDNLNPGAGRLLDLTTGDPINKLNEFIWGDYTDLGNQIAYAQKQRQVLDIMAGGQRRRMAGDPNSPLFEFAGGGIPTEPKNPLGESDALAKRYASTLQSLNKQYFDLTHAGTAAFVMYETEHGTLQKLDATRKGELMTIAQQIDAYRRLLEIQQANHAARLAEIALTTENQEAITRETYEYAQERDDLAFQITLMGKSSVEQEKLNAQRRIELDLRRNIRGLTPIDEGNVAALADRQSTVARLSQDAEDQKRAVIDGIDARQKAERSWLTGVRNGMHDYIELSTNTAAMSQRLFVDAFQGMEDALVKFVKTGKLEFRDLVDTIESDVLRLVIRQQITGPLAQMLGGAFGSAGSLIPGFGALSSGIGSGLGSLGLTSAAGWFSRMGAGGALQLSGPGAGAVAYTNAGGAGGAGMSASAAGASAGFAALALGDYMSAQNGRDWLRTLYGGAPPMAGKINEKLGIPEFFTDPLGAVFGHGGGPKTPQIGVMQAGGRFWVGQSDLLSQQEADTKYAQLNALLNDPRRYDPSALMGLTGLIPGGVGMNADQMLALLTQHIAGAEQPDINVLRGQRLSAVTQLKDLLGVDSLQQFRDNLKVSDLSTGSPMDQLGAARDTFQRDLSAVKFGDYSRLGAFQQEASQYLQLGRGVYASGQGYADIYAEVNSAIESVQSKTNEYLKDLPSTILQTSADQVAAIKAQTDELVTTLKDVGSKIDRLRAAGVE